MNLYSAFYNSVILIMIKSMPIEHNPTPPSPRRKKMSTVCRHKKYTINVHYEIDYIDINIDGYVKILNNNEIKKFSNSLYYGYQNIVNMLNNKESSLLLHTITKDDDELIMKIINDRGNLLTIKLI